MKYTELDEGKLVITMPKKADAKSNEEFDKVLTDHIQDGFNYFFLDLTESDTINSGTLRVILIRQKDLVPTMGRIMFIFDKKKNPDLYRILTTTNFVNDEAKKGEETIFGRWDTVEQANNWIPSDTARRTKWRSEHQEEMHE